MQNTGKYLVIIGLLIVVMGVGVYLFGNKLYWLGKLPGDIRVERGKFKFFAPITTMIIISTLLNLLIYVVRKLLN